MNKPSERIVVFVTPAQKRAIAASAEKLGISVSELMRRAVLNFGATSEPVKAASIVDRLRAPREPDALDETLKRVACGARNASTALPAALKNGASAPATGKPQAAKAPLLPADVLAALVRTPEQERAADEAAVVARVAAAEAAALAPPRAGAEARATTPAVHAPRRRLRVDTPPDEDNPRCDPAAGDGHFA